MASSNFFGQKPIAFDPLSGSVTVPSMPGVGSSFQFIIRDATSARQDLQLAADKLESVLSQAASTGSDPLAMFMIGSMERGNKVFRFQSYEALQLYSKLQQANIADKVPISGLYSYGAFSRVGKDMSKSQCALMYVQLMYIHPCHYKTQ
jgi:small ligand-binding sensory domain FIST